MALRVTATAYYTETYAHPFRVTADEQMREAVGLSRLDCYVPSGDDERAFVATIEAAYNELAIVPDWSVVSHVLPMYCRALAAHEARWDTATPDSIRGHDDSCRLLPSVSVSRLGDLVRRRAPDQYTRFVVVDDAGTAWQSYLHRIGIYCFRYGSSDYESSPYMEVLVARTDVRCVAVPSVIHRWRCPRWQPSMRAAVVRESTACERLLAARLADDVFASVLYRCTLTLPALVSACVHACRQLAQSSESDAPQRVRQLLVVATASDAAPDALRYLVTAQEQVGECVTVCRLAATISSHLDCPGTPLHLLSATQRRDHIMWALHWMTRVSSDDVMDVMRGVRTVAEPPLRASRADDRQLWLLSRMSAVPCFGRLLPIKVATLIGDVAVVAASYPPQPPIVSVAVGPTDETLQLRGREAYILASWLKPTPVPRGAF